MQQVKVDAQFHASCRIRNASNSRSMPGSCPDLAVLPGITGHYFGTNTPIVRTPNLVTCLGNRWSAAFSWN
jgi:hypothetical protein